jgi:geranylgeranyl diphosphate synthase type II
VEIGRVHDDRSAVVPDLLEEYGAVARGELERYLRASSSSTALFDLVSDYPLRGGRMLRPSLCMATARAFGASMDDAVRSGVALELLHNAFLVHDDVEDEGEQRRGRPTMNAMHGVPVAVNVGDALVVMSLRPLIENRRTLGQRVAMRVLEETERMGRESVEGQAIELGWRRSNEMGVDESDYLHMILKKTCWYTVIYPCRIGALIGTRDGIDLDRYVPYGFFVGAAFQIQDDLLNLVGDEARYGKELDGDLYEGKRTVMLIHLLRHASAPERRRLEEILAASRGQKTSSDIRFIRDAMDAYGSIDYARQLAHGLAGAARRECERVYGGLPASRERSFLEALPGWVLTRN